MEGRSKVKHANSKLMMLELLFSVYIKVKLSPLKAHGDARVHIKAVTALERGKVASLRLGRLYPGTHFTGG